MRYNRTKLNGMNVPLSRATTFCDKSQNNSPFDAIIEWLLAGLLAFMPLAFGAVQAWSEQVVIVLSGAIVICFLFKIVCCRDQQIIWSWTYVPLALFLLITAAQLISLPVSLVSFISPNTVAVKTELLGDLPNADSLLKSMTLSFYPNATKHDLRLVLAVAAVFVVVLNVYRRPEQLKRLLMTIAIIGGIIALITLAQNLFGNGKIYWFISSRNTDGYSGPFVNHSNYGQFMNLSIGAALGLLLVKLHEDFTARQITLPSVFEYISSPSARTFWLLIAVMGLGVVSVFISLTRGGMVSMLIATAFIVLLLTWRQSHKGHRYKSPSPPETIRPVLAERGTVWGPWIMVLVALAAFSCILYIGFDAVYDRLASLRNLDQYQSRWQILKDLSILFRRFPLLGTGLGTHSVVYPMFDRSTITALAAHAENEYAQALEETGLLGLGLLIIFGVIIWASYARSIRNTHLSICSAAYGLGFGILAILIHSLSDFGQHLPANAFLSAISCALLLALSRQGQSPHQHRLSAKLQNSRMLLRVPVLRVITKWALPCAFLACAILIWVWAVIDANDFRIAEAHWQKVLAIEKPLVQRNWHGTDAEYADLISQAAAASSCQPDNIKYRYWLNVYRWRSISQLTDPGTGRIIISDDSMPIVHSVVGQLHKARIICPTYGPTYSTLGQIEKFILNDDAGEDRIRKGFRLAPCDPVACFVAGCLDVSQGKDEEHFEKFKRAVQLDGTLFRDVANIYVNYLSRPHLAISIAGDDTYRLCYLAGVLEDMQYYDLAHQAREKAKVLLEVKCHQPDADASTFASLANVYSKQKKNELAIEYYRRALALNYGQVHWRLNLAGLLAETQQVRKAIHEAKICLRLQPQFEAAEKLIAELSVNPAAFSEEVKAP